MKSARFLVLASLILLMGYGVSVTLRAWGQQPAPVTAGRFAAPGAPSSIAYSQPSLIVGEDVRSHDPEMDKLLQEERVAEQDVAEAIRAYSRAEKDAERSDIKSKLAAALAKEFDLQQKRRKLELDRVEARLKKVRELMDKRNEARRSIIDNRLDQLIREAEGLGWTPPPGISLPQPRGVGSYSPGSRPVPRPL